MVLNPMVSSVLLSYSVSQQHLTKMIVGLFLKPFLSHLPEHPIFLVCASCPPLSVSFAGSFECSWPLNIERLRLYPHISLCLYLGDLRQFHGIKYHLSCDLAWTNVLTPNVFTWLSNRHLNIAMSPSNIFLFLLLTFYYGKIQTCTQMTPLPMYLSSCSNNAKPLTNFVLFYLYSHPLILPPIILKQIPDIIYFMHKYVKLLL